MLRIAVSALLAIAVAAASVAAGAVSAATRVSTVGGTTFTDLGFDTCTAPSLTALGAWLASPYRAVGIYVGGVNRACPDGNLSASWVESATAGGWSIFPFYVGLQAPCVTRAGLAKIDPASASSEGTAAADDAVSRAELFGLEAGSPVYLDLEGYALDDPACTQAVQQFVAGWVGELHTLGFVPGVYGSGASTIRDMVRLAAAGGVIPDQIAIGDWNGKASVFGDPYVPDGYWTNHQRIHQYQGGHDETWGGVTMNIDSDYLDAAVAGTVAPPAGPGPTSAGSIVSADGGATVRWTAGAFAEEATVTLTPSTLLRTQNGFAQGSYVVQLAATAAATGAPISSFAAPVVLSFSVPAAGAVPAFSPDGSSWTVLLRLPRSRLPAGATAGYTIDGNGNVTVLSLVPGEFGLLRDVGGPTRPGGIAGTIRDGVLTLRWRPATDNSGTVARYRITRGGVGLLTTPGNSTSAHIRALDPSGRSVFRVTALDAPGNRSTPSAALLVVRRSRPAGAPVAIPGWAQRLFAWQRAGRIGSPPTVPHPVPRWYWQWASWRLQPYRIERVG
jgi:hypothetical protein